MYFLVVLLVLLIDFPTFPQPQFTITEPLYCPSQLRRVANDEQATGTADVVMCREFYSLAE